MASDTPNGTIINALGTASDTLSPLEARIKSLRRTYGRGLGRKPSMVEKAAMARAARLTARAEMAARNPALGIDQLVRIDNAAKRARAEMFAPVKSTPAPKAPLPSLEQLIAGLPK